MKTLMEGYTMREKLVAANILDQIARDHLNAAIYHLRQYRNTWWSEAEYKQIDKAVTPIIEQLEELAS